MQSASPLEKTDAFLSDGRQEEKGTTEGAMIGWHHQLNGHEFELTRGDSGGQRSQVRCSPRGHKEVDTTEQLNNSNSLC